MDQPAGLYLHIPFCKAKCPYCDFYSVASRDHLLDAYTEKLCALVREASRRFPQGADTVYFGGGTPALLGAARFYQVMEAVAGSWKLPPDAEITMEANPGTVDGPLLRGLYEAGCNRLSLGLQSAVEGELKVLGRRHSAQEAADAAELASQAGFSNISLDLMLGIPGQTAESLDTSIQFCAGLPVAHVSAYLLKIEENTLFARRNMETLCPGEEEQASLYLQGVKTLEGAGFHQYEISNFARCGKYSRHNMKYWDCADYVGIGPSAHSFFEGQRYSIPRDLKQFLAAGSLWELLESEGAGGSGEEYAMLRLRLAEGLSYEKLLERSPCADIGALRRAASPMERNGLLTCGNSGISLTPEGFLVSNAVIGELLWSLFP